ncbi:MAG: Do family serine endopeptidase [Alphaproteobacteria bacterium]|nr:Do family serine endopeptidase [Alphaproteobacteria bacterium]
MISKMMGKSRAILIATIGLIALGAFSAAAQSIPKSREQITLSYAPLVKMAAPAVVNIYAKRRVRRQGRASLFDDPIFNRLFGDFPFQGFSRERIENSLGSGVIVRSEGLIVTNNHVIDKAQEITVVLSDRREFPATLVVADKRTDIAVLKVDTSGEALPALKLDDSDGLEVGDLVLAIGNPFGVGQTVTSGIVSALARTSVGISDFRSFIQTDAAINPGNSGGALLGMNGKLVGVNTAIYSRDGGSLGIGFAVPSNMVRRIVDSAISGKPLVRPWLSFTGKPVTSEIANALGLVRPVGVLIENVSHKGPGKKAGLRPGDVVVAVGRNDVDDVQALRFRIATRPIGDSVDLKVVRRGELRALQFDLVAPPKDPPRNLTLIKGRNPFAGVTVGNLSPALSEEIGVGAAVDGVIVVQINRRSTAARLGFKPHDIIRAVNGQSIERVNDLNRMTAAPQPNWRVEILRGDRAIEFEVSG